MDDGENKVYFFIFNSPSRFSTTLSDDSSYEKGTYKTKQQKKKQSLFRSKSCDTILFLSVFVLQYFTSVSTMNK